MIEQNTIGDVEQRELAKRAASKRRIQILSAICLISLGLKVFMKPPPPPKMADHSDKPFRALPGVLQALPESEKKKLTPQQLAMLKAADQNNVIKKEQTAIAKNTYVPQAAPVDVTVKDTKNAYQYSARKTAKPPEVAGTPIDPAKTTLVRFSRGGHLLVQQAQRERSGVSIRVDNTILASVPQRMVRSIMNDTVGWKPSVPAGHVQLKPAPGITVTLMKGTSRRITVKKSDNRAI